jgi:hypothetical protein
LLLRDSLLPHCGVLSLSLSNAPSRFRSPDHSQADTSSAISVQSDLLAAVKSLFADRSAYSAAARRARLHENAMNLSSLRQGSFEIFAFEFSKFILTY